MTDQEYHKLLTPYLEAHQKWLQSEGREGVRITTESFAPILELHRDWNQDKPKCHRLVLPNADLRKAELRGANLVWANLQGADLQEAILQGADLQKAILQGASLQGANLGSVNLRMANLQGTDLQGADLRGTNLQKAILQGTKLQGANLQEADLQGVNLQGADLQGASLQGANLQGADLRGTNLQKATLQGANLQGAKLQEAKLQRADLRLANLQGAELQRADLQGANLQETDFQGATLKGTLFSNSDLTNADFKLCTLDNCDFQEADLTEANFVGVTLEGEKTIFFGAKAGKIKAPPEFRERLARLGADLTYGLEGKEAEEKREEIKETLQAAETKDLILQGIEELKTSITHIDQALQANEGLSTILTLTGTFAFWASVAYVFLIGMMLNSKITDLDIDHAYGLAVPIFMFLLIGSALLRHDAKIRAQYLTLTQEKNKLQKAAGLMQAAYNFTKAKRIRLGEEGAKASEDLVDSTFRTIAKALLSDGKTLDDNDDSSSVMGELLKKIPNAKG